jgi:hypothetical protein
MTDERPAERLVTALLHDAAPSRAPDRLRTDIRGISRSGRQRPRWIALIKEPPMRLSNQVAVGSPMARLATTAVAGLALAVALTGAVLAAVPSPSGLQVGASPSPSAPPAPVEPPGCATPVVPVTGVTIFGHEEAGAIRWVDENGEHIHDMTFVSELDMDDDRLDGTATFVLDWDFSGPASQSNRTSLAIPAKGVVQGTYRIESEDGAWDGPITGVGDGTFSWRMLSTGIGSGDYEGLSATLHHLSSTAIEPDGPVDGVIYPTGVATCAPPAPSSSPTP